MKAIAIDAFGGSDKLHLMVLPKPEPATGEIRIRVKAAAVNPVDWKICEGRVKSRIPHEFPLVPGWDAAGTVDACGPGAAKFKPGDAVYAYCRKPIVKHGTYAEYVCVAESAAARKPASLSFEEAAAVPLAGLTAYQSLVDAAGLKSGQIVLVHAAAGGVGGFGVQIAENLGARVLGTAGSANQAYIRTLGVDAPIDYTKEDFVAAAKRLHPDGVDVVFDTVGGDVQVRSADALKKGGVLVSILAYADEEALKAKGIQTRYVFVAPNGAQLEVLARWADEGKLRVPLAAVLPLAEAAQAHEMSRSGHTRGKIVLRVG
jgi:NADPH:quinone reductase-like Zn-dependent oxidoreductase